MHYVKKYIEAIDVAEITTQEKYDLLYCKGYGTTRKDVEHGTRFFNFTRWYFIKT